MITRSTASTSLPDIARDTRPRTAGALDWVGMEEIEMPVTIPLEDGRASTVPARLSAFVDLENPEARGIHMSRLYLTLDRELSGAPLSPAMLRRVLRAFVESHEGLSTRAAVHVAFDVMLRRPALVSDESGWRRYPVTLTGLLEESGFTLELGTEIIYSSTCPCSAALARQLIQRQFAADFDPDTPVDPHAVIEWLGSERAILATPHSQRSVAHVRLRLAPSYDDLPVVELVESLEEALQTAVQAAVKREDEQAFALRNGQNLMFCEDAGRRIAHALSCDVRVADFWVKAVHHESLHPHDAVSVVTKGVTGGFAPSLQPPDGAAVRMRRLPLPRH